jgi:hypothetical protein
MQTLHYSQLLDALQDLHDAAKLYATPDLDLRESVMREVQMRLRADLNEALQHAERVLRAAAAVAEDAELAEEEAAEEEE